MKRTVSRCCAALLAALLALFLLTPCLAAEEPRVLRVAFPEVAGFTTTGEDGRPQGIVVDFLEEIAKYTGWTYEYLPVENDMILDRFVAGAYDLMGGTYYDESFESFFAYPDYSCGSSRLILLARRDDPTIRSYDPASFGGKVIAVYDRNTENIRRLQEYLKINDLDCTLKSYTYEEMTAHGSLTYFLDSGEADLVLTSGMDTDPAYYAAAVFDSQPHYLVTHPGEREILEGLNMALGRIYDADPNFARDCYSKNFPESETGYTQLNERDLAYIAGRGPVTVALQRDFHPLVCTGNADTHQGLLPDILEAVAAYTGLTFEYVYCDSYSDALQAVQQGEAELLGYFIGSDQDAQTRELSLTAPYTLLDSILVRNKSSSYPAPGLVGATLKGRPMPESIEVETVLGYEHSIDALADVNKGQLDFFYGISSHLEYIIQQENFTNIVQVNLINDSLDISFALSKPAQPELLTILNKAIRCIPSEQRGAINSRNMVSIGESHISLSSILYADPALAVGTVALFLSLILAGVILAARARLRAAAMRASVEKAEADSRAKSQFLSRMSHEIRTPMNAIVGLTDLTGMMEELPDKARDNIAKIKTSSQYLLNLINDILDMSRIESGKMEIAGEPFSLGGLLDDVGGMMRAEAQKRGLTLRTDRQLTSDVVVGDAIRLRQVLINLLSNAVKFTPPGGTVVSSVREEAASQGGVTCTFRIRDNGVGISPEDQQRIFRSFEQVGPNITKSQGTGLGLAISSHIVQLMGGELRVQSRPGEGSEFYFTLTLSKGRLCEEAPEEPEARPLSLDGAHILVAEDNDLNAEIICELLAAQGVRATRAETGKAALERFRESPPGTYHMILMDILMPEMNGLDAARAIRALPRPDAGTIPIVAMTANTFQEDVESARAAGMTGFLPKPVDLTRLREELGRALRGGRPADPPSAGDGD